MYGFVCDPYLLYRLISKITHCFLPINVKNIAIMKNLAPFLLFVVSLSTTNLLAINAIPSTEEMQQVKQIFSSLQTWQTQLPKHSTAVLLSDIVFDSEGASEWLPYSKSRLVSLPCLKRRKNLFDLLHFFCRRNSIDSQ